MPRLEIQSGRHEGKVHQLTKAAILGRGDNVAVPVPDGKASREHCRVFQQAGQWVVADLNSRNGITVNGLKTTRKNLNDGDTIQIGETVVMFRDGPVSGGTDTEVDEVAVEDFDVEIEVDVDESPAAAKPAASRPAQKRPAPNRPAQARPASKGNSARDKAFAEARAAAAGKPKKGRGAQAESKDIMVSNDVLQFNKSSGKSSPFSIELSQYGAGMQAVFIGIGLVAMVLVIWGIFKVMGVSL